MCQTPGCSRRALRSSSGAVYAHCDACTRRLLRQAFAPRDTEPTSWHELARAHRLPALVVGGSPA
jgi:hypothetical protein